MSRKPGVDFPRARTYTPVEHECYCEEYMDRVSFVDQSSGVLDCAPLSSYSWIHSECDYTHVSVVLLRKAVRLVSLRRSADV